MSMDLEQTTQFLCRIILKLSTIDNVKNMVHRQLRKCVEIRKNYYITEKILFYKNSVI